MSTPANIIIQNKRELRMFDNAASDEVLVFVTSDGYYCGSQGVIRTLTKAFNNEAYVHHLLLVFQQLSGKQRILNSSIREEIETVASSIIHAGGPSYQPASRNTYKLYSEKGWFYDFGFQYIITIPGKIDEEGDVIWEITLKSSGEMDVTRRIKEWIKFSEIDIALQPLLSERGWSQADFNKKDFEERIKGSIHLGEVEPTLLSMIYRDVGHCPCDVCGARPSCVVVRRFPEDRFRDIQNICEDKIEYARKVRSYLLRNISHDKQLQMLLEQTHAEVLPT